MQPIGKKNAGGVSDAVGDHGANGDVPGPRNPGSEPQVEFRSETEEHADHRAGLVGAFGEDAEQEHSEQCAVCLLYTSDAADE